MMFASARFLVTSAVFAAALAAAPMARAEDRTTETDPDPSTKPRYRDRVEFTMGFLSGGRGYSDVGWSYDSNSPSTAKGADKLAGSGPFLRPPYSNVTMLGVRYDVRVVLSHIRMTAGFDLPFSSYRTASTAGTYDVGGVMRQVTVTGLSAKEGRFGLGGEYTFGRVTPFIDVLGGLHWVSTDLNVDGQRASYSATSFGFSGRLGLRVELKKWFFLQAAGEVGFIGDMRWNAELSVGVALPPEE
jgi:hypothetical protein